MITIQDLIRDEKEAITTYIMYLNQGVRNPKMIPIIKKIIRDEIRHIKLLKQINTLKIV